MSQQEIFLLKESTADAIIELPLNGHSFEIRAFGELDGATLSIGAVDKSILPSTPAGLLTVFPLKSIDNTTVTWDLPSDYVVEDWVSGEKVRVSLSGSGVN